MVVKFCWVLCLSCLILLSQTTLSRNTSKQPDSNELLNILSPRMVSKRFQNPTTTFTQQQTQQTQQVQPNFQAFNIAFQSLMHNPVFLQQAMDIYKQQQATTKNSLSKSENTLIGGLKPLAANSPMAPNLLDTVMTGFMAVATMMALKILLPMLINPALALQFVSPKLMTVNPPLLPALYREPSETSPEYFHPYGNWGDYGYESMGYQGYGTAHSGCAPWWWKWSKRSNQFAPFSKTSAVSQ
eukprot:c7437_g1_i1.p1 GENE.c7437_g1_i1~~c7437_g1_i1.p1  ORF type:complete len:242 (-),score=101.01 c7437_g1_i1:41-766(-)